jgi:RNA polymerase sigma-70 factor (family 1)
MIGNEFLTLLKLYAQTLFLYRSYSDARLLEILNESASEKAFDELFRRYWHMAYQAAYIKLKSKEQAEEIVQDIFMGVWNKRGNLSILNFCHYLRSAIKYRVVDQIRSKVVQEKYWNYYKAFVPLTDEATDNTVAFDELMDVIDKKMETLPEKSRTVFYLNRLEGRSIHEIAALLKLSEKAIEYHLTRSLKVLKLHLRDFILTVFIFLNS